MNEPEQATLTIEGATWHAKLTRAEYEAWSVYADRHPHVLSQSYERTLAMFLSHYRRGVNLNDPLTP